MNLELPSDDFRFAQFNEYEALGRALKSFCGRVVNTSRSILRRVTPSFEDWLCRQELKAKNYFYTPLEYVDEVARPVGFVLGNIELAERIIELGGRDPEMIAALRRVNKDTRRCVLDYNRGLVSKRFWVFKESGLGVIKEYLKQAPCWGGYEMNGSRVLLKASSEVELVVDLRDFDTHAKMKSLMKRLRGKDEGIDVPFVIRVSEKDLLDGVSVPCLASFEDFLVGIKPRLNFLHEDKLRKRASKVLLDIVIKADFSVPFEIGAIFRFYDWLNEGRSGADVLPIEIGLQFKSLVNFLAMDFEGRSIIVRELCLNTPLDSADKTNYVGANESGRSLFNDKLCKMGRGLERVSLLGDFVIKQGRTLKLPLGVREFVCKNAESMITIETESGSRLRSLTLMNGQGAKSLPEGIKRLTVSSLKVNRVLNVPGSVTHFGHSGEIEGHLHFEDGDSSLGKLRKISLGTVSSSGEVYIGRGIKTVEVKRLEGELIFEEPSDCRKLVILDSLENLNPLRVPASVEELICHCSDSIKSIIFERGSRVRSIKGNWISDSNRNYSIEEIIALRRKSPTASAWSIEFEDSLAKLFLMNALRYLPIVGCASVSWVLVTILTMVLYLEYKCKEDCL